MDTLCTCNDIFKLKMEENVKLVSLQLLHSTVRQGFLITIKHTSFYPCDCY